MHSQFLKASDAKLLPSNVEEPDQLDLSVKTKTGIFFTSTVGIGPYLSKNGRGVDGILEASGFN